MTRLECKEETKRRLNNATRGELERLLKEYGYKEYLSYGTQYIIDFFIRKAYDHKKVYKIF